jgi:hypothetical protein
MQNLIVQIIQAMLAPGMMISACGLLILSMNNKYSLVVNRIRVLNEEVRRLRVANESPDAQKLRLENITLQLHKLFYRVRLVRNSVLGYSTAITCFILSSLAIGMSMYVMVDSIKSLAILGFLAGMISVLVGVCYAASEVWQGYKIIKIELEDSLKDIL